jgi:lambda family phage portal protein
VPEKRPSLLRRIVAAFRPAPAKAATSARMYAAARPSRTTGGLGTVSNTSADAELSLSLTRLRSASRQLVRDSAYAKRARTVVVNNVIGSGVGMQAQVMTTRSELNARVNAEIEEEWCEWATAANCHTGGAMHFNDLERAAMAQVFEAGEVFIRKHYSAFGDSDVPLALELIEPERLPADLIDPGAAAAGNEVRMGVECDRFGRAVAYWITERHQGDIRFKGPPANRYERVPASDIFHLRIVDRWPQTRGEPWLHTVLRKIDEMNEYTGSEVSAARAASYYFGTIKSALGDTLTDEEEDDGGQVMNIEPLTIQQLGPGEELTFHTPNRPNSALDPFLRYMLREVAAGVGVSYEALSRDYSQSNYSSSRLSLLDDRDLWRVLQQWWIRSFRLPMHKVWMRQAVLSQVLTTVPVEQYALDASKFEAVLFKPRGWSWIDPTKEVTAYKEAIKAGLISATDVIAATGDGRDIEDVVNALKREKAMYEAAGITVDTDVAAVAELNAPPAPATDPNADPNADDTQQQGKGRVVALARGTA